MNKDKDEKDQKLVQSDTDTAQKNDVEILSPKLGKQNAFLQAYVQSKFNVSRACDATGIPRRTVYNWLRDDPEFRELYNDITEIRSDLIKEKLLQLCESGNTVALIYCSKNWANMSDDGERRDQEEFAFTSEQADAATEAFRISSLPLIQYQKEIEDARERKELKKVIRDLQGEKKDLEERLSEYEEV